MKTFIAIIVLLGIAGGSWLYFSHRISAPKPTVLTSPETESIATVEKNCSCCAKRLARIKTRIQQQRQERKRQAQMGHSKNTTERVKRFLASRSEPTSVTPKSNP